MKRNIVSLFYLLLFTAVFSTVLYSCKKKDVVTPNKEVSLFGAGGTTASYLVPNDPNASFKIGLGITKPAPVDRVINFSVTSPTGAVEGTQYTISAKSVKIPAGKVVDSVTLKGLFSGFPTGRRDTLIFKITGGDIPSLIGSDIYKLVLQKFCPLNMSAFSGNFVVVTDGWQDYYPGDVVTLSVSGNTVSFYYPTAYNVSPILINVDPITFATSVASQSYGRYSAAGTLYSAKSVAGPNSVVVPCDNTISVELNHFSAAGNYGNYIIKLRKQ